MSDRRQHDDPELRITTEIQGDELRILTRCSDHGEQTLRFPRSHLLALARVLMVTVLDDEGVNVLVRTFLGTPGLPQAMRKLHQEERESGHTHPQPTDAEAREILAHMSLDNPRTH